VEAFLHELAERASGPLVAELARVPGTRETRWMQLLTGAAAEPAQLREATTAVAAPTELADLAARIDALTRDVESLKAAVAAIAAHRRDPAPSAE
jgi:uncharacterized protein YceH (UPF0502 family)